MAGLGNIVLAFVNGSLQRDSDTQRASETRKLESSRSEALLVLEMIKTADPDKAATNLEFLADSGLLSDKDQVERIHTYLKQRKPGQGTSLPSSGPIALDTDFNRGRAHAAKGEYDLAIADYSEAIRLNPKFDGAVFYRGLAYAAKQDYDRAIVDFNYAMTLDPKGRLAVFSRGLVYAAKQDYNHAIADFNDAIERDPKFTDAFFNRGLARTARQDYDHAAIADFNDAITLDPPKSAYVVLWLYLARARAGANTTAVADLETNAKNLKQADWPYPVVELFLGRRTPEATLDAAVRPDDRCEAQFYVGKWHLLQGDRMAAKVAPKAAEDTCPKRLIEYNDLALAELRRLSRS